MELCKNVLQERVFKRNHTFKSLDKLDVVKSVNISKKFMLFNQLCHLYAVKLGTEISSYIRLQVDYTIVYI